MSRPATPEAAAGIRRVERCWSGLVMAVIAFVLEKVVMRSVRKGGADAGRAHRDDHLEGGDVDLAVVCRSRDPELTRPPSDAVASVVSRAGGSGPPPGRA